jgi:hypothetical protein
MAGNSRTSQIRVKRKSTNSGDGSNTRGTQLSVVIRELTTARDKQRGLSWLFGAAAALYILLGLNFLAGQAKSGISRIEHLATSGVSDTAITAQTVYLVVRGTGMAAIVGGIAYFLLGLARSSLDQMTRYEKRLIASHLIDYALHDRDVEPSKLEAAHKIIEVWGSTVESAYTPPRVAKRVGGLEVAVSKEGGSVKSDSNAP